MGPKIYNEKRRIVFSTYHGKGPETAFEYLESYKGTLGPQGYSGLKAELEFYHQYGREFSLTVAGDMGEHADFCGQMGSEIVRFDVTTNINYKELKTYEKFVCDGFQYRIALLDKNNWNITDVMELSFPKCNYCGDSFIFPLALLYPMNYSLKGNPLWHNDQEIIEFCPSCGHKAKKQDIYNTNIQTYSEIHADVGPLFGEDEATNIIQSDFRSSIKYLSKTSGINIVGLAEQGQNQISKYENEDNGLYFPYLSDVVTNHFPSFFEIYD